MLVMNLMPDDSYGRYSHPCDIQGRTKAKQNSMEKGLPVTMFRILMSEERAGRMVAPAGPSCGAEARVEWVSPDWAPGLRGEDAVVAQMTKNVLDRWGN
jgi:hypothetical protein